MEILIEYGYYGLFIASFLAATILPLGSEFVVVALLIGGFNGMNVVIVATLGNWLGGMTSYYIGRMGKLEWIEKYFNISKEKLDSFQKWFRKYGDWISALAFLPAIGDFIAVGVGFFRGRWWVVAMAMLVGKFLRYLVLMYLEGYLSSTLN